MNAISILKVSGQVTIQDGGRNGYEIYGISKSGFFDKWLYFQFLKNFTTQMDFCFIEIWHGQLKFCSLASQSVYFLGDLSVWVNDSRQIPYSLVKISQNDQVFVTMTNKAVLGYIAILGSWDFADVLGSYSTHKGSKMGGYLGRSLRKGDILPLKLDVIHNFLPKNLNFESRKIPKNLKVRWKKGPEFYSLTDHSKNLIQYESFTISLDCSRQGFRLIGPDLTCSIKEIETSAAGNGVIQLLPDGQLVVLMCDSQTTGGYPRVGWLTSFDVSLVANLSPGSKLRFEISE